MGATALALLLSVSTVSAQPLSTSSGEEKPTHTVEIRGGTPGAVWEVHREEGNIEYQEPLARCGDRGCTLEMKPGKYRLWVEGAPGSKVGRGETDLHVNSDLDLTVRAPKRNAKGTGLAVAIVGKVSVVAGFYVAFFGLIGHYDCEDSYDSYYDDCGYQTDRAMVATGLGLVAAGAVAIPVGWVTFARNRGPRVERTSRASVGASERSGTRAIELGIQRLGTGYGLGTRVRF